MRIEAAFPSLPALPQPTHLTHAGDGTNRLFVTLKSGTIMVFPNDQAASSAQVFLDIHDRVNSTGSEEGLLGLTFDPQYAANGYLYVNYTATSPRRTVVSRFTVSRDNSNRADPDSELVILEVGQPYANHNGGTLAFGPDGYLYIALGDGGSGGDPHGNGQNLGTLLGKLLRIDVRDATRQEPYRIPPDNPFVGSPSARPEIWAYGLRNPWKFSFDSLTGDLWAGDVGQNAYEEVDIIRKGANYGWNVMEGAHCYPPTRPTCSQTGLEPPVVEYGRDQGCSITGGYVYRGARLPGLAGAYIYGDYCSGRIWALRHSGPSITDLSLLVDSHLNISSFGVDESQELFILDLSGGRIYRLAF